MYQFLSFFFFKRGPPPPMICVDSFRMNKMYDLHTSCVFISKHFYKIYLSTTCVHLCGQPLVYIYAVNHLCTFMWHVTFCITFTKCLHCKKVGRNAKKVGRIGILPTVGEMLTSIVGHIFFYYSINKSIRLLNKKLCPTFEQKSVSMLLVYLFKTVGRDAYLPIFFQCRGPTIFACFQRSVSLS